ncbi:porin [Pandoraea pneumonica]|uniref:porin n=1 Tax=Pandoraea pneumonica TaxID=2508299 RepID=UPI003CFA5460
MNKTVMLTLAATLAVASNARAQSNVTLYGILDEGVNYNSNAGGARSVAVQSGVMQGSRWGMRGSEDLGGGLSAVFMLENGFDLSSGKASQGGLLFGRQAYVGLQNGFGTLTIGRQNDSGADFVGPLESGNQWSGNIGAHPGDLDNLNNTVRTNNAVKFRSRSFNGASFGAMYSFGGVAGSFARNQVWSLGAGYDGGPLALAVGYLNVRNPNVAFFGNATTGTPSATVSNSSYPIYSGYLSANSYQVFSAGGRYTFGPLTFGLVYANVGFDGLGSSANGPNPSKYSGSAYFNLVEANLRYVLTPALSLGVAYTYTSGSRVASAAGGNNGAIYRQVQAGADYLLSTRTDVYLIGTYQQASGTDSRNLPAVASINNQSSPSTTGSQTLVRLGIRHRF